MVTSTPGRGHFSLQSQPTSAHCLQPPRPKDCELTNRTFWENSETILSKMPFVKSEEGRQPPLLQIRSLPLSPPPAPRKGFRALLWLNKRLQELRELGPYRRTPCPRRQRRRRAGNAAGTRR